MYWKNISTKLFSASKQYLYIILLFHYDAHVSSWHVCLCYLIKQQERRLKRRNTLGGLEISIRHQIVNTLELSAVLPHQIELSPPPPPPPPPPHTHTHTHTHTHFTFYAKTGFMLAIKLLLHKPRNLQNKSEFNFALDKWGPFSGHVITNLSTVRWEFGLLNSMWCTYVFISTTFDEHL